MTPPLISIIMPVYNGAAYLAEALDSLIAQSFPHWELIAVDDGSTDDSATILKSYQQKDSRIQAFHSPHQGIVKSLNQACRLGQAPFLARMDADDIALPTRLESQLRLFEKQADLDLCGTCVALQGPAVASGARRYESWVNSLISHEAICRELFVECPLPHPTFMMKASLYHSLGGYAEGPFPEDYDFMLRAAQVGAGFGKTEERLLLWCDHNSRLSRRDARYDPGAFRALKRRFLPVNEKAAEGRLFYQWGAGEVGKAWLKEWDTLPVAVVDINPRKIGKIIHRIPVIKETELPSPGECFIVIAVGTPGARADIRSRLIPRGYQEGEDFIFIA